ncbi:MAG TPA: BON domain-containing protein [Streptosporangiaceae bacterium]|nr:BON domain-containing protein [Streptosporangiaceae bacterium]
MRSAILQDAEQFITMPGTVSGQIRQQVDADRRDDREIRQDVLRALLLDSLVPMTVDAQVRDGIVTLIGTVSWQGECDDAMFLVGTVPGVLGVLDEISPISPKFSAGGDVEDDIVDALERSAGPDDGDVRVTSSPDGTVILSGAVTSWDGHDRAIAVVWSVPGVTAVADRIQVLA